MRIRLGNPSEMQLYPITNNSNTPSFTGWSKELYSPWIGKALSLGGVKTPPKLRFSLSEQNMPIAIGDERYWGKGIGKKVIKKLIDRAKIINLEKIYIPAIYKYNDRSRNLFTSLGFIMVGENEKEESFELKL